MPTKIQLITSLLPLVNLQNIIKTGSERPCQCVKLLLAAGSMSAAREERYLVEVGLHSIQMYNAFMRSNKQMPYQHAQASESTQALKNILRSNQQIIRRNLEASSICTTCCRGNGCHKVFMLFMYQSICASSYDFCCEVCLVHDEYLSPQRVCRSYCGLQEKKKVSIPGFLSRMIEGLATSSSQKLNRCTHALMSANEIPNNM